MDSFPDPFQNQWDSVMNYMYDQEADVILSLSNEIGDTIHLGVGIGLYCLIDLGDVNHDKKSDIALVVDVCDHSRVNTCYIYTLCNNKWTELKSFGVHEDAFDFTGDSIPTFNEIKGFLEYQDKKWMFKDYNQNDYDNPEDVGKMKPLKLNGC